MDRPGQRGLGPRSHIYQKGRCYCTYSYHESAGKGVCAYVVDTGIDDKHPVSRLVPIPTGDQVLIVHGQDFEGRAKQIKSFVKDSEIDDNGHGTHCAGTVGSKTWGIAKHVQLYGIKVLASNGSGQGDAVVKGYEYVAIDAPNRTAPAL